MLHRENLEFLEDVIPRTEPLKKIKETAEKTAAKVTSAADGYEQVDGAIADAAAGRS